MSDAAGLRAPVEPGLADPEAHGDARGDTRGDARGDARGGAAAAKVDRILDAAYGCFVRHGIRKTTMDDIASAAGMSRPAVYQYVRNKEDTYRRLAARIFDAALTQAQAEAGRAGTLAQRLDRILGVRLVVTQRLVHDSPHAGELIGDTARVSADLDRAFRASLTDLVSSTIVEATDRADLVLSEATAREIAELAVALTRGLEAELADPERIRERLRNGIALLVAGVAAAAPPSDAATTALPP